MRRLYVGVITLITIVCVIAGMAIHFGGSSFGFVVNNGTRIENGETTRAEDIQLDSFTKIRVETDVMGLNVEPGDDFTFSYYCTKNLIPQYEVKDGVLYITQEQKNRVNFGNNNCDATVTIPEGILLEMVQITSDVGDIWLDRLAIVDLSVYCDVGDVNINETTFGYAKIELDVGDLDISDSEFENIDAYSNVGDVDIHSIMDLSDYSFDIVSDIGDIEVNGREYKDECRISNSEKLVKIGSDIGDVEISWGNTR